MKALVEHYQTVRALHLRQLFADDPRRGERFTAEAAGIYLDYSKNRITDETIRLLMGLARECGLGERIAAMFRGEQVNVTEKRAVLHTALRAPETERVVVDGVRRSTRWVHDFGFSIGWPHSRSESAAASGRDNETGKRILQRNHHGSAAALGPVMAVRSVAPLQPARHDIPLHLQRRRYRLLKKPTRDLDPARNPVCICSKNFTTLETLTNAHSASLGVCTG